MPVVTVKGVYSNTEQDTRYYVVLQGSSNQRLLVWVGQLEAYAIQGGLAGARKEPPETFLLFTDILKELGAPILKVDIDTLENEIFHASIFLVSQQNSHRVKARPSDAINLAIRAKAPISVADELWEAYSTVEEN